MTIQLLWPPASVPVALSQGEVHVWAWDFNGAEANVDQHAALLDPAERDRLGRFHFAMDRARFATSHAFVRRILGAYTHCKPEDLRFLVNKFDKPSLIGPDSAPVVQFNLSHTSTVGLLAVDSNGEIGVDVESVRPIDCDVAESYFSLRELSELNRLEGQAWLEGFYRCWTRKEAILKAEGVGLNHPLADFDVSLSPSAPAELIASRIPNLQSWYLHHLSPAPDAIGALAVAKPGSVVRCFRYESNP